MRRPLLPLLLLAPLASPGQQGYLPLSRTVDDPYTALMHQRDVAAHSSIRPFLREDLTMLPGADTLAPPAWAPWLDRMADPGNRWHGAPLVDAVVGSSFGETDALKYRLGAGGLVEWNATPRLTFSMQGQGWHELLPNYLDRHAHAQGVTPGEGRADRSGDAVQHHDWGGYADYKAGKYFHFTLGKGRNFFGEGHRSLFLSDEAYSYPFLRITTTAWHLRYVNLFAYMRDLRPDADGQLQLGKKFTSMHFLSWNVSKRVNVGFFEAIVWQDNDPKYPRGFDISYLNPVIFLRPVEFGLGSPDNALMGMALNVKVGTATQLYSQVVLDEFLLGHVRQGDGWYGNKQGVQAGVASHNAFRVGGLSLRGEMNYARPFMYTHTDNRQNYAHYGQPLAHPYGSGFLELLAKGGWRTGPWLVENTFSWAVMGRDTTYGIHGNYGNNIFLSDSDRPRKPGGKVQDLDFRLGDPSRATVVQNEFRAGRLIEPRSGLMLELAWTIRAEEWAYGPSRLANYLRLGLTANLQDRHPFQALR